MINKEDKQLNDGGYEENLNPDNPHYIHNLFMRNAERWDDSMEKWTMTEDNFTAAIKLFQLEQKQQCAGVLLEALMEIVSPIKYMQQRLQEGEQLNGMMAIQLSKDAAFLQSIAQKAISSYELQHISQPTLTEQQKQS